MNSYFEVYTRLLRQTGSCGTIEATGVQRLPLTGDKRIAGSRPFARCDQESRSEWADRLGGSGRDPSQVGALLGAAPKVMAMRAPGCLGSAIGSDRRRSW